MAPANDWRRRGSNGISFENPRLAKPGGVKKQSEGRVRDR
jgi:hypothetical protein